jgi:hypothetical protein
MKLDFTLERYADLLDALKEHYQLVTVERFVRGDVTEPFVVLRHDVDRYPSRAARMARLERNMEVHSTYNFRYDPKLPGLEAGYTAADVGGFPAHNILDIKLLGHEIGYHYENLSSFKGDRERALKDFTDKLVELRKLAPVVTAAMHGAGADPLVGEDLDAHKLLGTPGISKQFATLVYITDRKGPWRRGESPSAPADRLGGTGALIELINSKTHTRLMLHAHPHRWSHGKLEWLLDRALMR